MNMKKKEGFSLIELMIVVVILGALTAIILPQFDVSETEVKDTACDASNYGTLRQLASFRSANGVYPTGFHTGYAKAESIMPSLPDYTNVNIEALEST